LHHDRISTIFGNDVLQEMLDFINR
jgi:hypothetical protein